MSTLTIDDIYRLFQETTQRFQDTERLLKQQAQEAERRFQETERLLTQQAQEAERRSQEADRRLREAQALFTSQWGRLMEALVKPSALRLFQERGIPVTTSHERILSRKDGEEMELDLLLVDGEALVDVKVKTTLRVEDVRDLQEELRRLPRFFPRYRGMKRFGAVAFLHADEQADRFAYRQGLFVLRMGRDGLVEMVNDTAFHPRDYAGE